VHWTVVIPAKALPEAKSRLAAMSSDPAAHRRLVEAIRRDTVAATLACADVARVVLVIDRLTDGPLPDAAVVVLVQQAPGLNAAVSEGARHAFELWPADGVAALVGDLPALRPEELTVALSAAAGYPSVYVPDAAGTGTTMLAVTPGHAIRPAFGLGSAARHAETSAALETVGAGLRTDVDTADDLRDAADLGLGPATCAELVAVGVLSASSCRGIVGE
jgi:2-phospho-L-lactate guanylyltransferase